MRYIKNDAVAYPDEALSAPKFALGQINLQAVRNKPTDGYIFKQFIKVNLQTFGLACAVIYWNCYEVSYCNHVDVRDRSRAADDVMRLSFLLIAP